MTDDVDFSTLTADAPAAAGPLAAAWEEYYSKGWSVFPVGIPGQPLSKSPPLSGVTGHGGVDLTREQLEELAAGPHGGCNLAARMPVGSWGLDVDCYHDGHLTIEALESELGALPANEKIIGRPDGSYKSVWRVPPGWVSIGGLVGVEFLQVHHRFCVLPPSWNPSVDDYYYWEHGFIPRLDDRPWLPQAWLDRLEASPVKSVGTGSSPAKPRSGASHEYDGLSVDWLKDQDDVEMCLDMWSCAEYWIAQQDSGESHYDSMRDGVRALVGSAVDGHQGVRMALDQLRDKYSEYAADERPNEVTYNGVLMPAWEAEWERSLDGAVGKFTGEEAEEPCGCISVSLKDRLLEIWAAESEEESFPEPPQPDELADFWSSRDELRIVRDWSRHRLVSPWATLGVVLCRVAGEVPPWVTLPALVGGLASLNYFTAVVAASGGGKGGASSAARDVLEISGDEVVPLWEVTPGSGEGLVRQYAVRKYDKSRKEWRTESLRDAVLFDVAEIDGLVAVGRRSGATLLTELRKAWSGETLGHAYADQEKAVMLAAHSYRMSMVVGVQPRRAGGLLDDSDGGTPQRFLWAPGTDPHVPELAELPALPPRIVLDHEVWEKIAEDREPAIWPGHSDEGPAVFRLPDAVIQEIRLARWGVLRGLPGAADDSYAGHLRLLRLKTAALLAVLRGLHDGLEITTEDWTLAGLLIKVSEATRRTCQAELRDAAHERHAAAGRMDVVKEEAVVAERERRVERKLSTLIPANRREIEQRFDGKARKLAQSILDRWISDGSLQVVDGTELDWAEK